MKSLYLLVTIALLAGSAAACHADEAAAPGSAAKAPSASLPELLSTMVKSEGEQYTAARDEMMQRGPDASQFLKPKLADPDWHVRAVAEVILDRMSRPQVYNQYAADLDRAVGSAFGMRPGPFRGLLPPGEGKPRPRGSLNDAAAVPFLLEVLVKGSWRPRVIPGPVVEDERPEAARLRAALAETYPRVARCYAALCLGMLNDPRGVDPLVESALAGGFPELSAAAANALGRTGRTQVVMPLLRALEDTDTWVRDNAAWALGETLAAPVEPLRRLADTDRNPQVRFAAKCALRRIEERARERGKGHNQ